MKLSVRTQSQRDPRWGSILLGYNQSSPYTIYNYGCLITSLANYVGKSPDEVNQLLKDNAGFTQNSGNFVWAKCSVLGLTQTYLSPWYDDAVSSQAITKIKESITQGFPLLAEVDFNPADVTQQQHFVLLAGLDDIGNILVVDPWEGQWETWSEAAVKRNVYQFRTYDKKVTQEETIEYVPVPKAQLEDFQRVKDGWNQVREKLNVEDSVTVVLAEVEKLISYEDAVVQKDKQLTDAQSQIQELKISIQQLQETNTKLASQASVLTQKATDLENKYQQSTQNYENALTKISELEKAILSPVRKGWKAFLVSLIDRV